MIIETLESLKANLDGDGRIRIHLRDGTVAEKKCLFFNPASLQEMNEFNFVLPDDYKTFLTLHNGVRIFTDDWGSGVFVHSLKETIQETLSISHLIPQKYYCVMRYADVGYFLIDEEKVEIGEKDYLFFEDIDNSNPPQNLKMTFEEFIEKLIEFEGELFWLVK
ncbi:SMI1/KNR4 family protein [Metabacillus sp. JX24]|uniref:SMI1/KNR4 family protein n=1 Tax=Metabacillus sp. JX24 TaxID=3240759 RepID=UPI00350F02E8